MMDSDMKWYFIFAAAVLSAMFIGMGISEASKSMAKRDIIVACYQAGNKDCESLWDKEIK